MLIPLYLFNSMVLVQLIVTSVFKYRSSQFRKVRSIFFHFVRRDTSHLSETVSCFIGRYDYIITITFFHFKYFLYKEIS